MSELIAITFEDREAAYAARQKFAQLSRSQLVELADSVVAYKDEHGQVRLDQTVNLAAAGAAHGGFWGLLLGLLFSIPVGAAVFPMFTTVFGAGFGALGGHLSEYGIDDAMMRRLSEDLEHNGATLFVLVRDVTPDKVLKHLEGHNGTVLTTSLPANLESKLHDVLERAQSVPMSSHTASEEQSRRVAAKS